MMKTLKTTIPAALIFVIFILISQGCAINGVNTLSGDGNIETVTHEIDKFDVLKLSGSFNVILSEGEKENLVIETDENLHQHINVEIKNDVLHIYSDRDIVLRPTKLDIHVTYTGLEKIISAGACRITADTTIRSEAFTLELSGAGSCELNIETEELKTNVSGAASIILTGAATTHKVSLSGAGSLKAEELITENTVIDLSGAGAATVHATESLNASLSGVGSIKYTGNPEIKHKNVSGIGIIKSID